METTTEQITETRVVTGPYKWEQQGGVNFLCLNPKYQFIYEGENQLLSVSYAQKGAYWYFSSQILWSVDELKGSNYGVWEQESHRCHSIEECLLYGATELKQWVKHLNESAVTALHAFHESNRLPMLPRLCYICTETHKIENGNLKRTVYKGENMDIKTESEEFDIYICVFPDSAKKFTLDGRDIRKYFELFDAANEQEKKNTKPSTPADGMQSIFAWKGKKFSIEVSLGENEGKFCIQWNWSLQQKEGGSKGDSHTSGYVYESKESAVGDVIGKVNGSILKKAKDFAQYNWAAHFIKQVPEASPQCEVVSEKPKENYRWSEGKCSNPSIFTIYNADGVVLTIGIAYNKTKNAWFSDSHQKFIDSSQIKKVSVETDKGTPYKTFNEAFEMHVEDLLEWTLWYVDNKGLPIDIFERVKLQCNKLVESNFEIPEQLNKFLSESSNPQQETVQTVAEAVNEFVNEPAPIIKKVDGLDQIQLFEVEEQKKARNPDAELFGYVAKDKIDRQRFKRKISLLIDKLKELPPVERNALVRAVNSKFTPPHF